MAAPAQPKPARPLVQSEREKMAVRRQLMDKVGYYPKAASRPQPTGKPTTRLFDLARKRDEDLLQAQARAREEREKAVSSQCSFQPATLHRRRSLGYDSLSSAQENNNNYFSSLPCSTIDHQQPAELSSFSSQHMRRRSAEEFFADQMRHVLKVEIKLEGALEQRHKELLDESVAGAKVIAQTTSYYQGLRQRMPRPQRSARGSPERPSFQPEINAASKRMRRSGSVEEGLYQDALRREERLRDKRARREALEVHENGKVTLDRSEKAFAQRIAQEFKEAV